MELALKIAALGMTGALCTLVVRRHVPELGVAIALAAGALLLGLALSSLSGVTDFLEELQNLSGLSPGVLAPMLKTVGIAMVTRYVSALCKDAGESGISAMVETAGAVAALLAALPLLRTVMQMLVGLLRTQS